MVVVVVVVALLRLLTARLKMAHGRLWTAHLATTLLCIARAAPRGTAWQQEAEAEEDIRRPGKGR